MVDPKRATASGNHTPVKTILDEGTLREAARTLYACSTIAPRKSFDELPPRRQEHWLRIATSTIEAYELNKPASPEALNAEEGEPVAWRNDLREIVLTQIKRARRAGESEEMAARWICEALREAHPKPSPATGLVEALNRARENFLAQCEIDHPFVRDIDAALSSFKTEDGERASVGFSELRTANTARQQEWDAGNQISLTYRATELAGELGEACNIIKKLERERLGIRGSRDTVEHLAEELADIVICTDLIAMSEGIDLQRAVVEKFNATSEKVGLATRLPAPSNPRPVSQEEGQAVPLIDSADLSHDASAENCCAGKLASAQAEGGGQ